jgi:hypothetical protein
MNLLRRSAWLEEDFNSFLVKLNEGVQKKLVSKNVQKSQTTAKERA